MGETADISGAKPSLQVERSTRSTIAPAQKTKRPLSRAPTTETKSAAGTPKSQAEVRGTDASSSTSSRRGAQDRLLALLREGADLASLVSCDKVSPENSYVCYPTSQGTSPPTGSDDNSRGTGLPSGDTSPSAAERPKLDLRCPQMGSSHTPDGGLGPFSSHLFKLGECREGCSDSSTCSCENSVAKCIAEVAKGELATCKTKTDGKIETCVTTTVAGDQACFEGCAEPTRARAENRSTPAPSKT